MRELTSKFWIEKQMQIEKMQRMDLALIEKEKVIYANKEYGLK